MEYEISLEGVRFHARHGVFPQEEKVGNTFIVHISVRIPWREEIAADDLSHTVSYADLFDIAAEEMGKPRNLLEAVASSIVEKIRERWPFVLSGRVDICKSTPPIAKCDGQARVSLFF